jgi:hypothetical protein
MMRLLGKGRSKRHSMKSLSLSILNAWRKGVGEECSGYVRHSIDYAVYILVGAHVKGSS